MVGSDPKLTVIFPKILFFAPCLTPFSPFMSGWLVGWVGWIAWPALFGPFHAATSQKGKKSPGQDTHYSPPVFLGPPPPPSLFVSISGVMNMVVVWCTEQYMVENMWARFGPLLFPETRHLFSLAQVYTVSELTVQQQNEKNGLEKIGFPKMGARNILFM